MAANRVYRSAAIRVWLVLRVQPKSAPMRVSAWASPWTPRPLRSLLITTAAIAGALPVAVALVITLAGRPTRPAAKSQAGQSRKSRKQGSCASTKTEVPTSESCLLRVEPLAPKRKSSG